MSFSCCSQSSTGGFRIRCTVRVEIVTAKAVLQRLKPRSLSSVYVVAEATTYKDYRIAAHNLQSLLQQFLWV